MAKSKTLELTVLLDAEQVEELFGDMEIKFSAAKFKRLAEMVSNSDIDIKEQLEQTFLEVLEEMIGEEWGE